MTENTIITGKENMIGFRLLTLRRGLMLEMKGLKLSRGPSAYSIIKREFGFTGNKQRVLDKFTSHLNRIGVLCPEVSNGCTI